MNTTVYHVAPAVRSFAPGRTFATLREASDFVVQASALARRLRGLAIPGGPVAPAGDLSPRKDTGMTRAFPAEMPILPSALFADSALSTNHQRLPILPSPPMRRPIRACSKI
jgi:hypothetical protein